MYFRVMEGGAGGAGGANNAVSLKRRPDPGLDTSSIGGAVGAALTNEKCNIIIKKFESKEYTGNQAINEAVVNGCIDVLKYLAEKKAFQFAHDNSERIVLAARYGQLEVLKWFYQYHHTHFWCQNFTPIIVAHKNKHFKVVEWLCKIYVRDKKRQMLYIEELGGLIKHAYDKCYWLIMAELEDEANRLIMKNEFDLDGADLVLDGYTLNTDQIKDMYKDKRYINYITQKIALATWGSKRAEYPPKKSGNPHLDVLGGLSKPAMAEVYSLVGKK